MAVSEHLEAEHDNRRRQMFQVEDPITIRVCDDNPNDDADAAENRRESDE
jgi:hypothetical protein